MRRREFIGGILGAATCLPLAPAYATPKSGKPNFIFMLSDDQNWNGLSVSMDPEIRGSSSMVIDTPSLARLAQQGMRFSQAYAPAPVCSPTRISLQTGKSPASLHWTKAGPPVRPANAYKLLVPVSERDIRKKETTIAEVLKDAGYTTAHYGKWHIGGGGPESHGYDESDGDTGNADAAQHKSPNPVDIFGMGRRAAAFIEKSKKSGKPFYVQLSYHALHYPENANPDTIAKYRKKMTRSKEKEILRAAITEDLDTGIGELLAAIDRLKLADNTYVIYMSDNGGGGQGKRGALKGGKGSLFEGGIRSPFIVRGPGVEPGTVCRVPVVGQDLLPTLAELAGSKKELPSGIEGGSFSPLLHNSGKGSVKRSREELVWHFPHYQGSEGPHSAIRIGDHKLIRFYENDSERLYDLSKDLLESNDLGGRLTEKKSELSKRLSAYLEAVDAELPSVNKSYDSSIQPEERERKERPERGSKTRVRKRN